MKIKTIFHIGIILFLSQPANSMGWGDWLYTTKNGTRIKGDGGVRLNSKGLNISLIKWYYYKNHIIGYYQPQKYDEVHKGSYFILDEISKEFNSYSTKEEWKYSLKDKGLEPIITRWFTEHCDLGPHIIFIMLLPVFYVALILLLFFFMKDSPIEMPYRMASILTGFSIVLWIFSTFYIQSF